MQEPQASSFKLESSWSGDETELTAASPPVEDLVKSQEGGRLSLKTESQDSFPKDEPKQADSTVQPKQPETNVWPKQHGSSTQPTESTFTTQGQDYPMDFSPSDSPVKLEGWVRLWENLNGIPSADISWLKEDPERGLFTPVQTYKDSTGLLRRRRVMKSDCMWFYPPEPPGHVGGGVPTPQPFFRSRVFVWRPVGVWRYSLKCPRGYACLGAGENVHLCESGFHHRVRHICDVNGWYTMLTEVLRCGPCTKAASSRGGGTAARWLAWDADILWQLSEAHQAVFPAVLTSKRGVDKNVLRLLRDRTVAKVWRQIQENHKEEYLQRKDLYTTLVMMAEEPEGFPSYLGRSYQTPPPPRELPSARLLRHAFLLAEANSAQDYRSQILSTFGTVLTMDSTKMVAKKLSGEGEGSAEWFTSIRNEHSQIVTFVLTREESADKLEPMCQGVMERFQVASQPVPKILYVDRGCCHAQGLTAVETLFQPWVDKGMVVRLDIFHWMNRFDAAICSKSHPKYPVFKSALVGAVLAYSRTDLDRLIEAVRARDQAALQSVSDEDVVLGYISKEQLKHHVRRVTLGVQETFCLTHLAIEELKGAAGLDENGVSLFKTPDAIDEIWTEQQRHLQCIQDPPDMDMYSAARTTSINGVDVPRYKCLRGDNSLEGFHKALPHMIPGSRCAARSYQVYLISGIARWNADRSSDAAIGGKGRHYRAYSAPLIDRLNARCVELFGEGEEEDFRAPADFPSDELLGLEYLLSQSMDESGSLSLEDLVEDGAGPEEAVVQPGQPDPDEVGQKDEERHGDVLDAVRPHITLSSDETPHPPVLEDSVTGVCSTDSLPRCQPVYNMMVYVPPPSAAGARPQPPLPPVLLPVLVRQSPTASTTARPVPSLSASTTTPGTAGSSTRPVVPTSQAAAPVIARRSTSLPRTVPIRPAPQRVCTSHTPSLWSRATIYKRKQKERLSEVGAKVPRTQNLPVCTMCGQPTQGHKKYKKKSFCPVKMMSPSKGLNNRVYASYEHFTSAVDELEDRGVNDQQ